MALQETPIDSPRRAGASINNADDNEEEDATGAAVGPPPEYPSETH